MNNIDDLPTHSKNTENALAWLVSNWRFGHRSKRLSFIAFLLVVAIFLLFTYPDSIQRVIGETAFPIVLGLLCIGLVWCCWQVWKGTVSPSTANEHRRPSVIKGPLAFTENDGDLFSSLGRERLSTHVLTHIQQDKFPLIVVYGDSGVGKTSLLRAGLATILSDDGLLHHYWEATSVDSERHFMNSLHRSWLTGTLLRRLNNSTKTPDHTTDPPPTSIDDLLSTNSDSLTARHVIVIDQLEQLGSQADAAHPILRFIRTLHSNAHAPHRITVIASCRKEYLGAFIASISGESMLPTLIPVRGFSPAEATRITAELAGKAALPVDHNVISQMIADAVSEGEVSPVNIGIGLLVLSEISERQGGRDITIDDLRLAGGSQGLLTSYLEKTISALGIAEEHVTLKALRALCDPFANQRVAEGVTCAEIASLTNSRITTIQRLFSSLSRNDVRVLQEMPSSDGETRYRLVHDQFVYAIRSLARDISDDASKASFDVEQSYAAWIGSDKEGKYLLTGKKLKRVLRYESRLHWGKDKERKQQYVKDSKTVQLRSQRCWLVAIVVLLFLVGWGWHENRERVTVRFLADIATLSTKDVPRRMQSYSVAGQYWVFLDSATVCNALQERDEPTTADANVAIAAIYMKALRDDKERRIARTTLLFHSQRAALPDLATVSEAIVILDPSLHDVLWTVVGNENLRSDYRLKAACVLAHNDPNPSKSKKHSSAIALVIAQYVSDFPNEFGAIRDRMSIVKDHLEAPLLDVAQNRTHSEFVRITAARLYAEFASLDEVAKQIMFERDPEEINRRLDSMVKRFGVDFVARALESVRAEESAEQANVLAQRLILAGRYSGLSHGSRSETLKDLEGTSKRMSYLVAQEDSQVLPDQVLGGDTTLRAAVMQRIGETMTADQIASILDDVTSVDAKACLVIAIGMASGNPSDAVRARIKEIRDHAEDPELAAACHWVMESKQLAVTFAEIITRRQLKNSVSIRLRNEGNRGRQSRDSDPEDMKRALEELQQSHTLRPSRTNGTSQSKVYVGPAGVTMIRLAGGQVLRGRQKREPQGWKDELFTVAKVSDFDMGAFEVTAAQFLTFLSERGYGDYRADQSNEFDLHMSGPATHVTWYQAAEFCNWMNEAAGVGKDEWCYLPNEAGKYEDGMTVLTIRDRTGYRLPTSDEWEYACRAGSKMRWSCGDDPGVLSHYATFFDNSHQVNWPVGSRAPNAFGIFDLHGSMGEWCHEPTSGGDDANETNAYTQEGRQIVLDSGAHFDVRGGNFFFRHGLVRCAQSVRCVPSEVKQTFIGFRIARSRAIHKHVEQ